MIDTEIWNAIAGVLRVAQQTRRRAGAPDDLGALHIILFGDFKRHDWQWELEDATLGALGVGKLTLDQCRPATCYDWMLSPDEKKELSATIREMTQKANNKSRVSVSVVRPAEDAAQRPQAFAFDLPQPAQRARPPDSEFCVL